MLLLCFISSRLCLFCFVFLVPTGSKGLPGVPGYQGTHGLPGDPSTAKGQFGDPGAEGLPGIKGMPGLTGNRGISGFGGMPGYKVSRSLDGSSTKGSHRGLSPHPSLLLAQQGVFQCYSPPLQALVSLNNSINYQVKHLAGKGVG